MRYKVSLYGLTGWVYLLVSTYFSLLQGFFKVTIQAETAEIDW